MSKFKNVKWDLVEHNWSDTSIYDENRTLICTKSISTIATEETQEELENEVSENFKLIVAAPEMFTELEKIFETYDKGTDTYKRLEILINKVRS